MQQSSGAKKGLKGGVSQKCLGTEVPVDCKSVRIRLMVLSGLQRTLCFTRKGLGCIRVPIREIKMEIPDKAAPIPKSCYRAFVAAL